MPVKVDKDIDIYKSFRRYMNTKKPHVTGRDSELFKLWEAGYSQCIEDIRNSALMRKGREIENRDQAIRK